MHVWLDFGGPVSFNYYENGEGCRCIGPVQGKWFDEDSKDWVRGDYCAIGLMNFDRIDKARRFQKEHGGRMFRYVNGKRVEVA